MAVQRPLTPVEETSGVRELEGRGPGRIGHSAPNVAVAPAPVVGFKPPYLEGFPAVECLYPGGVLRYRQRRFVTFPFPKPPAARMVCEPASESTKSRIVLDQLAACAPTVHRSSVCIPAGSVSEIASNAT